MYVKLSESLARTNVKDSSVSNFKLKGGERERERESEREREREEEEEEEEEKVVNDCYCDYNDVNFIVN